MPDTSMIHAQGTFQVSVKPTGHSADSTLGSHSLDKQYHGDLEATARGEMLSAGGPTGSGGYVAMERVTGKLQGKTGTFAIMQYGTMTKGGSPQMTVTIVPGSGTGELSGINGAMTILIADGKHSYDLGYYFSSP